jgi:hypothetical protein
VGTPIEPMFKEIQIGSNSTHTIRKMQFPIQLVATHTIHRAQFEKISCIAHPSKRELML